MAQPFRNTCQFNAVSSGTGDFVVDTATADHDTPQNLSAKDGKAYHYYAESADGLQWEQGDGAWTAATTTLARTTINSSSTGSKVDFTAPPIVSVFPSPPPRLEIAAFDAGTLMLFQQTAAPTGWTKQTTHNDKALRVVSGTASSGGTNAFSSMFASRTTDGHTITLTESAYHTHSELYSQLEAGGGAGTQFNYGSGLTVTIYGTNTGAAGSNGAHTHTYDMRVQYVDLIIASKDAA